MPTITCQTQFRDELISEHAWLRLIHISTPFRLNGLLHILVQYATFSEYLRMDDRCYFLRIWGMYHLRIILLSVTEKNGGNGN